MWRMARTSIRRGRDDENMISAAITTDAHGNKEGKRATDGDEDLSASTAALMRKAAAPNTQAAALPSVRVPHRYVVAPAKTPSEEKGMRIAQAGAP
jgi:hypothetical protein